jgi:HTH-type transcriptional regulator / antitoxin HipB
MYIRTPRDIGLIIRENRRRLGLGQAELAQRVGVSRQWLLGVEKGKRRVDAALLLKTLTALGLSLDVRDDRATHAQASPRAVDIDAVVAAARRRAK